MNDSYEFDCDTGELNTNDKPIDINFRKVDGQKVKKQIVRKLICDRRENRGGSRVRDGSQSSFSQNNDSVIEVQSQGMMG